MPRTKRPEESSPSVAACAANDSSFQSRGAGITAIPVRKLSHHLLKRLRQKPELSSLVIVMVTTETELSQMTAALEAGANEYIMKPFTRDILVEKLELVGIQSLTTKA